MDLQELKHESLPSGIAFFGQDLYCIRHTKTGWKLLPYEVKEKDGTISFGLSCPKCHVCYHGFKAVSKEEKDNKK